MDIIDNTSLIAPSSEWMPNIKDNTCAANKNGSLQEMCLPVITGISDDANCSGGRSVASKCFNALSDDEKNTCDAQVYCFYTSLRIAASCKVAMGVLDTIQGQPGSCEDNQIKANALPKDGELSPEKRIEKYCDSMCSYPPQQKECNSQLGGTPSFKCIPTTLLECINYYYQNHPIANPNFAGRLKYCIGDVTTPFCLSNCLDFGQPTLDNSRFLCTY